MPSTKPKQSFALAHRADSGALVLVLVVMALSWFLVSGVATAVYNQYEKFGDPPKSMGPAGGISASQLGHEAYFWSERAFHYRTTLMFALDDYDKTATLSMDSLQQHPEGVNAWAEYTLLMEPVYGQLYRWFGRSGEPLVEFLLRLIPLVHVLLFLPIFFLARSFGIRPWLAFSAVLIYATCTLGFHRLAGSLLLKENFSLLWLMIFMAAHHRAINHKNFFLLLLAAVSLFMALVSWHLSQFLLLIVFLAAGMMAPSKSESNRKFWPGSWWPPAVYLLTGIIAGLTPSLLSRGFFLSLPMAALTAWLISTWWSHNRPGHFLNRMKVWLIALVVLGALSFFNPLVTGDYNHVSGLLLQKIAHGFVLPDDPSSLPFDVRVFWAPPFTSPHLNDFVSGLGYHLLLLLPAGIWLAVAAIRRRLTLNSSRFLLTVLAYLAAWLMIDRLGVVFWPLAVVAIALAAEQLLEKGHLPPAFKPSLLIGLLIISSSALNLAGTLDPQIKMARLAHAGRPIHMGTSDAETAPFKVELFEWLRRETPGPGSSYPGPIAGGVLGETAVSPQVLLYARRPTVLNSQFENSPIRERYHEFLKLLYGTDEKAFNDFLEKTDTAYLFINRNWATSDGPGAVSWQGGVEQPLSLNMLMLKLHFSPDSLAFLQPVFDNEYYRVFRVGAAQNMNMTWQGRHSIWWDASSFTFENGSLKDPQKDRTRISAAENRWSELQTEMQQILDPQLMNLHQQRLQLGFNSFTQGTELNTKQIAVLDQQIANNLKRVFSGKREPVGALLQKLLQGDATGNGMFHLLKSEPAGPINHASAGQLLGMLHQYEMAADELEKAAEFFPLLPMRRGIDGRPSSQASPMASRLRQECVWWNIGAGRYDHAAELAAQYISFEAPGSRQAALYRTIIEAGVKKGE